jgi:hypothetical protein
MDGLRAEHVTAFDLALDAAATHQENHPSHRIDHGRQEKRRM